MIIRLLTLCTTHSRPLLIIGLLAGIGLPQVAAVMQPWLPHMVAILLVITAFRIGHRAAFGAFADLRWSLPAVLVLQLAVPICLIAVFALLGVLAHPMTLALVLACSAPTISGGTSIACLLYTSPSPRDS